jgi:hypothetical protein
MVTVDKSSIYTSMENRRKLALSGGSPDEDSSQFAMFDEGMLAIM